MGDATRAKIRLAERFGSWPFAGGPAQATAAQVILLAEALRQEEPEPTEGKAQLQQQPKVSRAVMEELARKHGSTGA